MQFIARRSNSRLRAKLEAQLVTLGGVQPAIMHDLSTGGAKLSVERPPRLGNSAVLRWEGFEAFGTVVWVRDGQFGLWFDDLVDEHIVIAARDAVDSSGLREREKLRLAAMDWVAGHLRHAAGD